MKSSIFIKTIATVLFLGSLRVVTASPTPASADLQQIKTVFVIALENHNLTQPSTVTSPQQILGNPAAPYLNSLVTPGNSNAVQVSYATRYYNSGVGVHPSEPNYVWQEAASDFGFHADSDPSSGLGNLYTARHFTAQLNAAGIPWKNYQENVSLSSSPQVSAAGSSLSLTNPYYGNGQYYYAAKHNPMAFFTDTGTQNVYELSALFNDLTNNAVGRYNWITPNLYDDAHSALPSGFTYAGTSWTGDQAGVAQGDNFLSIVVPQIMASAAYQNNGMIVIWFDETEGGDTTNFCIPEIIISPLAKGNAYASTLEYSHSSDLKTMEEIFGLSFVSNAIPASETNVKGYGYNFVANVNDLSDMFNITSTSATNAAALAPLRDVFVIALENHNFTQPSTVTSPQQILGNPAAPYLNSLVTPGNSNAVQVSYATHYYNSGVGVHPSEPSYVWGEAASDFGFHADSDPSTNLGNVYTVPHLTAQLNAAGIPWKNYQEDVSFSASPQQSVQGASLSMTNPYYGSGLYYYAAKHNPMAFFTDTCTQNVYELSALFNDLTNNAVGRYNWITPNLYDDAHNALSGGFTYAGTNWTGDQAGVAQADNFLSIVVPQIMASAAYQNNGMIVIWFDETEGGDTTNFCIPEIIISPLAKGNAYASTLEYSHSSDLKTMEEIFGLSFVSNAIPASETNVKGIGYNFVANVNDLSDMFLGATINGTAVTSNRNTAMTLSGTPGESYTVLASDNLAAPLSQWAVVGGGQFSGSTQQFTDTDAPNHPNRFYTLRLR